MKKKSSWDGGAFHTRLRTGSTRISAPSPARALWTTFFRSSVAASGTMHLVGAPRACFRVCARTQNCLSVEPLESASIAPFTTTPSIRAQRHFEQGRVFVYIFPFTKFSIFNLEREDTHRMPAVGNPPVQKLIMLNFPSGKICSKGLVGALLLPFKKS